MAIVDSTCKGNVQLQSNLHSNYNKLNVVTTIINKLKNYTTITDNYTTNKTISQLKVKNLGKFETLQLK